MKNRTENPRFFGKYDILVIIFILCVNLAFFLNGGNNLKKGVIVEIDGKPAYILTEPGTYSIERDGKWLMDVEYDEKYGGRVKVVKSSCKLKICVKKGWIRDPKDSIVCVPNKVVIHFRIRKGLKFDEGIDVYTW